jgi:hypothetical protein
MIGLAQQQRARIAGQSLVAALEFHRPIERRFP